MSNIISLIRKDYVNSDGRVPVYLKIYIGGRKLIINPKVYIEPKHWDNANKQVLKSCPKSRDLNIIIDKSREKLSSIITDYRIRGKELTVELLKKEFYADGNKDDFWKWAIQEAKKRKGTISATTVKLHVYVLTRLQAAKPAVQFNQLNIQLVDELDRYFAQKRNKVSTREAILKIFKTYVNRAISYDLIKNNPFEKFRIKRPKYNPIYLDYDQVKRLWELYDFYPECNLKKILRLFLFSCETGLRHGDARKVMHDNIINGILYFVPIKTRASNTQVRIPLTEKAKLLISHGDGAAGKIFETFAEQVHNRYLKDIAADAEIKKNVSSHVARHTFATLFYRRTKDLLSLQRLLGHSKIDQTLVYASIDDSDLILQMKKFEE